MKLKQIDKSTRLIEQRLMNEYLSKHPLADIRVYRYNPAAIRVRIVDPDFAGMDLPNREQVIWPILEKLPEDVRLDVTVCLLITPEEQPRSMMNLEFEDPLPSGF